MEKTPKYYHIRRKIYSIYPADEKRKAFHFTGPVFADFCDWT